MSIASCNSVMSSENIENSACGGLTTVGWALRVADAARAAPRCAVLCSQGPRKRAGQIFTIGVVGRCLSKALVQAQALTPKCRELVLIAAPKDSRVYLQYPESASALVQKVAELQRAAGVCRQTVCV